MAIIPVVGATDNKLHLMNNLILIKEWAFLQDIPDMILRLANEEAIVKECEKYGKKAEREMRQKRRR